MSDTQEKIDNIEEAIGADALFSTPEEIAKQEQYNKQIIDKIKTSLKKASEYNNKSIIKYIELGKILLEAKKELGIRFSGIITDKIISTKQVQRYIKFIITIQSEKDYVATVKAKKENIDLLIADTRITDIVEDSIKNMIKPSMNKLIKMKALSEENFKKVLNGDDTELDKYLKELNKEAEALANIEKYEEKPENMDKDTFDKLLKMGVYEITRKYQEALDRENELKKENEILKKEQIKLNAESSTAIRMLNQVTSGKLYTISENKEAQTA